MTPQQTRIAAALLGLTGVALGAFGAHALKPLLLANGRLDTYELAVRYQFFHALALLILGMNKTNWSEHLSLASLAMLVGVLLFSGSLYLLALWQWRIVAFVTPLGGVFMLAGWALLLLHFIRNKES